VHHAAAEIKPDCAEGAGAFGSRFQQLGCSNKILARLGLVELGK
jgi:hypothetical protein